MAIRKSALWLSIGLVVAGVAGGAAWRFGRSRPEAREHLRVGHLPVTGHAKFFVAKEEGLFQQEGLDVELVEFTNSADGLSALRAGQLDVGAFGTTAPLVHIAKGAGLSIIGGVMGEDAAIITTADAAETVKSVADLKGKKVATVRLATGDAVLRGALSKVGLDWKQDLQIFELKNPPAVIEAVKTKQVDAGVVWGPHDLRAEEQGLKVAIRSAVLQPGHPCCRIVVNQNTVAARRQVWHRFMRAVLKAELFTRTHHAETVRDIAKYLKLEPKLIERAYYQPHLDQSSDPNRSGIEEFWRTMKESKFVDSSFEIAKYIDPGAYRSAVESLVAEQPNEQYWRAAQALLVARN